MPEEFVFYGKTWEEYHPDWEMKLWTDDNMPPLINQELYDNSQVVLKSDIARFELLYQFGGVYIDTDFECYKNIEPIIKDLTAFSAGEADGIIGNAIMGSTPGHPVFLKVIKAAPKSIRDNKDCGPNIKTGPVFMTKTLSFKEIHVFSPFYFFPTPPASISPPRQQHVYPEAYANHHWSQSWVGAEDKINFQDWMDANEEWKTKLRSDKEYLKEIKE